MAGEQTKLEEKLLTETPPASGISRRSFLFYLGAGLNAIAGALFAIPVVGYVFSSFRQRQPYQSWIALGTVENIPCWVRRQNGETFQVFAINCTHLGCPVRWFEESHLFMCPCHGGAFYED